MLDVIRALWRLMVAASRDYAAEVMSGAVGRWEKMRQETQEEEVVTREGYTEMHLRISKVLRAAFDLGDFALK